MPLSPGSRLGDYQLLQPLGAGGMGVVWLAKELRLGRNVALKLLPVEVTHDAAKIARFQREARAASTLNHPNVCTVLTLGESADGQHYIAMEYVEGKTLRMRLAQARLSVREALDIGIQVGTALSAAHDAGVVHRDIKPENVMLRPDGIVKVLDFGIAKLTDAGSDASGTTQTALRTEAGAVLGTIAYMSPEQARGEDVDPRTDIWSLGVVLYEMVAGRSPFDGPNKSDALAAILDREPPPLARFEPEVPPELQRIVTKALKKSRAQRYQVVQDLLLDLQALRDDLQARQPPSGTTTPGGQTQDARHPWFGRWQGLALAGGTLLALGAAWAWLAPPRETPSAVSDTPAARNLTRLTFDPGLQNDVSWSPDGTQIAYASDTTGNFDIWVRAVAGGAAVQLTRSPAEDTQPSWSPDGRSIAFRSGRDNGGIFVVPAGGGAERQLAAFGEHPRWSSDGATLLFRFGNRNLYMVPADGGAAPRQVLQDFLRGGDGGWDWIASHPDGRISVLGMHRERLYGFYTVSMDGRQVTASKVAPGLPVQLLDTRPGSGNRVVRFEWSQSGGALFVEAITNEVRSLWRVRVDERTLEWTAAERLTTGAGDDIGAAVSRDGTRLAFTTEQKSSRIWLFPFDAAKGRVTGEGQPVTPEGGLVKGLDLASSGRTLAYALRQPGTSRVDLWTLDLESRRSEVIAQNSVAFCVSADGQSIGYGLFRSNPSQWAVAVRLVGGPERLVSPWSGQWAFLPSDWTREGALLGSYLAPPEAPATLAIWPSGSAIADRPIRVVASRSNTALFQGRISPNGRWLSVVADRQERQGQGAELWIAPAEKMDVKWTRIASDHHWADVPRWAPDGRTLYFMSRHGSSLPNVWGVRIEPDTGIPVGAPFEVTKFDAPNTAVSMSEGMGIAQERAMLTMTSVKGNIWLLEGVDR